MLLCQKNPLLLGKEYRKRIHRINYLVLVLVYSRVLCNSNQEKMSYLEADLALKPFWKCGNGPEKSKLCDEKCEI